MKQKLFAAASFLSLVLGFQLSANAGIIVSFVQTSAASSQNVSVDVYASADSGTQVVGDYGFTVTLSGTTSGLIATTVAPVGSSTQWGGLWAGNSSGLTFRGGLNSLDPFGGTADPYNVTIGTGQNASTKVGSISFLAQASQYTISAIAATTARNLTNGGTGFFTVTSGSASTPVSFGANAGTLTITAVPEPSSLALAGLCLGGAGVAYVRARKKRKS